jgi:hypothetical protein
MNLHIQERYEVVDRGCIFDEHGSEIIKTLQAVKASETMKTLQGEDTDTAQKFGGEGFVPRKNAEERILLFSRRLFPLST